MLPPLPRMLKIMDDDDSGVGAPDGAGGHDARADPGRNLGERRREHGHRRPQPGGERTGAGAGLGRSRRGRGELHVECEPGAEDCHRADIGAGTVTITAVDDDVYGPGQQVTATGTVAGQPGLEAPYARTLTITDDDDGGAVPPDLRCRGGGGHQSPPRAHIVPTWMITQVGRIPVSY